jgi:hypothetical protein
MGFNSQNRMFEPLSGHAHEHGVRNIGCVAREIGKNCIDSVIDYGAIRLRYELKNIDLMGSAYAVQEEAQVTTHEFNVALQNSSFGGYLQGRYQLEANTALMCRIDYHHHGYKIVGAGASSVQENLNLIKTKDLKGITFGLLYDGFLYQKLHFELIHDNMYEKDETHILARYLISY